MGSWKSTSPRSQFSTLSKKSNRWTDALSRAHIFHIARAGWWRVQWKNDFVSRISLTITRQPLVKQELIRKYYNVKLIFNFCSVRKPRNRWKLVSLQAARCSVSIGQPATIVTSQWQARIFTTVKNFHDPRFVKDFTQQRVSFYNPNNL